MAKMEHTHQKLAELDQNWQFGHQNNVWWSIKFGLFFLEIGKNLSKTVRSVQFFNLIAFMV